MYFEKNYKEATIMKILGINGWTVRGHDGGATLIEDGRLKFAIEEERLIGIRHAYDRIPYESIKMICQEENVCIDNIDKVAIGWNYPVLWKMFGKEFISKEEMSQKLFNTEHFANKIVYVDHHFAHACSAFYPSNFTDAIVLVIDGQGELIATSVFVGKRTENKLEKVYETQTSLGYFYAAVTEHIGFYSGQEGKTMGLASYGKPVYLDTLRKFISADNEGKIQCFFIIDKKSKDEEDETIAKWSEILSTILPKRTGKISEVSDEILPYANLASSAQKLLEEILVNMVSYYCTQYKISNVAIAGGVGLNCAANGVISELPCVTKVFTQPAANDGGISLGAALAVAKDCNESINFEMIPYQGNCFTDKQIEHFLKEKKVSYSKSGCICKEIAKLVSEGKIVANFQGRLEFGPRALGNRSILADPRKSDMLYRLNVLKGREVWRPLAPAVLFDKQKNFFSTSQFSPYMTINCEVLQEVQAKIEAVTHVDGTARIQSVSTEYNPLFYDIIKEFYNITGIPVMINTSFNIKGEPIVATPEEALKSAIAMKLDYLAIGDFIIKVHN